MCGSLMHFHLGNCKGLHLLDNLLVYKKNIFENGVSFTSLKSLVV